MHVYGNDLYVCNFSEKPNFGTMRKRNSGINENLFCTSGRRRLQFDGDGGTATVGVPLGLFAVFATGFRCKASIGTMYGRG